MTSFVNDNGEYLDYAGDDFTLTKQALSITDLKIKGTVSVNFKLDNNSLNRKALGYYGPQQVSGPAYSKTAFTLIRNGNVLSKGFVVVQKVTQNTLDCYFISGNSSWFNDLQFNIQEIDLDAYHKSWNYTDMVAQKSATAGIIFPLIDVAYKGQKFPAMFVADPMYLQAGEDGSTVLEDYFCDIYPCFYLHTLMEELTRYSGYKFSGDLITNQLYNSTVITPSGGALLLSDIYVKQRETLASLTRADDRGGDVFIQIVPFKQVYDGSHNLYSDTNYRWTADGNYMTEITVKVTVTVSQGYVITIYKNGSTLGASGISTFTGVTNTFVCLTAATPGDYFEVWMEESTGLGFSYSISAGSTVLYTPKQQQIPNRTIVPNAIIPTMKAIDLVKAVAMRFGCVVTFDDFSKTVNFNQIDKIQSSEDWSAYLVGYEYIYEHGFKNNYIKLSETSEFENYNKSQPEGYGGGNILTDFDVNQDKTLFDDPFGAALDTINNRGNGMVQPYIEFVSVEDGDSLVVTGVTSAGGYASFTVTGMKTQQNNTIMRTNVAAYYGYHAVSGSTATTIVTYTPYTQNGAGNAWPQNMSFNDSANRLLVCVPNYTIANIGPGTSIDVYTSSIGHNTHTTWPFAYFSKPITGRLVDNLSESLSYGELNLDSYNDRPLISSNFNAVSHMMNSPIIRAQMLVPESVFQSYNFDKRVYISCKEFSGYFWIDNFQQYRDSNTPVTVDLRFMSVV